MERMRIQAGLATLNRLILKTFIWLTRLWARNLIWVASSVKSPSKSTRYSVPQIRRISSTTWWTISSTIDARSKSRHAFHLTLTNPSSYTSEIWLDKNQTSISFLIGTREHCNRRHRSARTNFSRIKSKIWEKMRSRIREGMIMVVISSFCSLFACSSLSSWWASCSSIRPIK